MKNRLVLTTLVAILLICLIPMDLAMTQDIPATAGVELDPTDLDFALINDSELWLKTGSALYHTLDAGKQWNEISPETSLIEPYLLVSASNLTNPWAISKCSGWIRTMPW